MESGKLDKKTRAVSVKAAINMYGYKISNGNLALLLKKCQANSVEKPGSKKREIKVKPRVRDMERLKELQRYQEELALVAEEIEEYKQEAAMKELELTKLELSKLKLDMASAQEHKSLAEKETQATNTKIWSNTTYAESLTERVQDADEERVLLELARIEAQIECEAIEAKREQESGKHSSQFEQTKKKMKDLINEIEYSKELETKLAETTMDIVMLRNELDRIRRISLPQVEKLEKALMMQTVSDELESAKIKLGLIKQEGFKFMKTMDIVRDELKHVTNETSKLRKSEKNARVNIQKLDLNLDKATSRLEAAVSDEEKAREFATKFSQTLQQLNTEASAANKETEIIRDTIININKQNRKNKAAAELTEAKLNDALQELEKAKSSELNALEQLKTLTSKTTGVADSSSSLSSPSSIITISKSELLHLTEYETRSKETADKKIEASRASIKALKCSQNEISLKTKHRQRELHNIRLDEKREIQKTEKSLAEKRGMESELRKWRRRREKNGEPEKMSMRIGASAVLPTNASMRENRKLTPGRQTKYRKSPSPLIRYMPGSCSIKLRKRRKIMPDLSKVFTIKKIEC